MFQLMAKYILNFKVFTFILLFYGNGIGHIGNSINLSITVHNLGVNELLGANLDVTIAFFGPLLIV